MKHSLKILLAIILVFMFCSVAAAAEYKFRVAYTDAPRLQIGNEKLIHVTVAAVYAFDNSVNAMTGGAFFASAGEGATQTRGASMGNPGAGTSGRPNLN
jgi:hypothetical protein